jgi:hypothetical protein
MTRGQRLTTAGIALASAAVVTTLLTAFSSATEGPLTTALDHVGVAFNSFEQGVRERLSGPGRRNQLTWFEQYRGEPARLHHPSSILVGAYDSGLPGSLEGIRNLERALDTAFPLIQVYSAWGDNAEHKFPLRTVTSIWDMGSIPVITWEPWLAAFDNARHPHLPLREARDQHGLAAVARGEYDFYIDAWASEAAEFGRPVFVRFAHEMNDPYRYPWGPQHNTKEEFIAAWRRVVARFRGAGARNVIWVWSPHVAHQYWDLYYPGAEFVDWTATGALNFGPVAQWSQWWSFAEIFGTKYQRLAQYGKPIMIAEFGSLEVGGDRQGWYRAALQSLPTAYPAVRALLFFNAVSDQTVTYQKVDWSFLDDHAVTETIATAIRAYRTSTP